MQIARHTVVSIDYTVRGPDGAVIDSSEGGSPLAYLHGTGGLIPGLEAALEGKASGESLKVNVPAAQAYGERNDTLTQVVPREAFDIEGNIEVGMRFHASLGQGVQVLTVTRVEGDQITLDGNHPLAGLPLDFDVTVIEVRPATEEEVSHGHVHGPDGHHH
jgi:FKBP-type peptidyl-prolyl cis-trans isomerase SlyD